MDKKWIVKRPHEEDLLAVKRRVRRSTGRHLRYAWYRVPLGVGRVRPIIKSVDFWDTDLGRGPLSRRKIADEQAQRWLDGM